MPQHQNPEHVPQPVKKRSRFSNITTQREDNLPTHQRNVPAGFVRDLLDDEDSEDDPDFDGDIDLSEEDDDPLDDFLEPDVALDNQNSLETPQPSSSLAQQTQPNTNYAAPDNLPDEDPEFEVDSLDSTDNEDDNDDIQQHVPPESPRDGLSDIVPPVAEFVPFGDIELNSDDEEDDPDFEANIEQPEIQPVPDIDEDDDEPGQSEARDEDYIQFLMSLLADNGEDPPEEPHTAEITEGPSNTPAPISDAPANLPGDDDDDFDYLRASAMMHDDPLEYRDDLHVSRREVAQLLFNNHESTLRRQTRTLKGKKAPAQPLRRPYEVEHLAPPVSLRAQSVLPGSSASTQPIATGAVPLRGPGHLPTNNYPTAVPQTIIAPQHTSFMSLSPAQMSKFNEQSGVYIQILTDLHAVCKKKLRANTEKESSGESVEEVKAEYDPKVASEKSEYLLNRILENQRVSTAYHAMIKDHITKMKDFSEDLLHQQGQSLFNYEMNKSSAYDRPAVALIEPFLRECETAEIESLPGSALKPFEPYERKDVRQSLSLRPNQRQYTMSGAPEGWFAWTTADDNLLAMTIAKYGRECGDYVKDLLPHRLEDDCETRVRYLASRRCQDNPVKRQVLHISSPLNRDELRLVEIGLQQLGGKIDDPNVWKQIQRQYLPTREWSHLQKLWLWRETRRKYKATYRAKLSRKKSLNQGTVVGIG